MKLTFLLFPILLLFSCDTPVQYQFTIHNKTAKELTLIYAISLKEDTITIAPEQTKLITQVMEVAKPKYDYYKNFGNIFYKAVIFTNTKKAVNIAERNLWELNWEKVDIGVYNLTIDSVFLSSR